MNEGTLAMKEWQIGQRAEIKRTFTAQDLAEFFSLAEGTPRESGAADSSTDTALLARRVIPGPLLGGMFSRLLGTELPGRGTNYLKQRMIFPAPAYTGQEITARVEITRLRPEKDLVNLRTVCLDSSGQLVCDGAALVLVKELEMHSSEPFD